MKQPHVCRLAEHYSGLIFREWWIETGFLCLESNTATEQQMNVKYYSIFCSEFWKCPSFCVKISSPHACRNRPMPRLSPSWCWSWSPPPWTIFIATRMLSGYLTTWDLWSEAEVEWIEFWRVGGPIAYTVIFEINNSDNLINTVWECAILLEPVLVFAVLTTYERPDRRL